MSPQSSSSENSEPPAPKESKAESAHDLKKSYKTRARKKRTSTEKAVDTLTQAFGSMAFLIFNLLFFVTWIILNTNVIPNVKPFDPYPFILLTMIVSLEAICLTVIVLMSQNRESKVSHLRAEIDTRVDIVAEEEITKVLGIVVKIARKNGIDVSHDSELKKMMKPVDKRYLEKKFEEEVG